MKLLVEWNNGSITSCWKVGTMGALHHAGRWGDNKGDGVHISNALVWEEECDTLICEHSQREGEDGGGVEGEGGGGEDRRG